MTPDNPMNPVDPEDTAPVPVSGDDNGAAPGTAVAPTRGRQPLAAKGKALIADAPEATVPPDAYTESVQEWDDFDEEDDEDEEMTRRFDANARRRARRLTGALALVAALGIGFAGGIIFQKHQGSNSSANGSSLSSFASRFAGLRAALSGGGGGGGGGGGAPNGSFRFPLGSGGSSTSVVGTVSAVANGTLYVSDGSSSALVKVVTSPTSSVTVPQSSSVSAVQPGDTVIISGAKQSDGSYMAASIRDSGASPTAGAAAAGGALPGGGGGGAFFSVGVAGNSGAGAKG